MERDFRLPWYDETAPPPAAVHLLVIRAHPTPREHNGRPIWVVHFARTLCGIVVAQPMTDAIFDGMDDEIAVDCEHCLSGQGLDATTAACELIRERTPA